MLVISLATSKTKDFLEFLHTLKKFKYEYKIVGMNQKWKGLKMKIDYYLRELKELPLNKLVLICDSYDILFLQGPKALEDKYRTKANGKVVIGLENQTDTLCSFIPICDADVIKKCNIKNPYHSDFKYINSGFILGPVHILLDIFKHMKQNIDNIYDDQQGLYLWVSDHCDQCYFDYNIDFVFNHMPITLISKQVNTKLENGTGKIKVRDRSYPIVVHMPGQYLDVGYRSEKYRNFVFNHKRVPTKKTEYLSQGYKKACAPECFYIGYWWFIVLIILILICVYFTKFYNSTKR